MPLVLLATLVAAPVEEPAETHWYGWQTLVLDAAAFGAFALAVKSSRNPPTEVAGAVVAIAELVYVFGGPVVHIAHDHQRIALLDLGLRVGLPILGALAIGAGSSSSPYCGACGAFFGFALGAVLASVVDAAVLSVEKVRSTRTAFVPSVAWAKGRDGVQHPAVGLLAAF